MKYSKDSAVNQQIREKLKEVCALLRDHLYESYLFGSCARGTATKDSDIDIAVVTNAPIALPVIDMVSWHFYEPSVRKHPVFPIHIILFKEGITLLELYKDLME